MLPAVHGIFCFLPCWWEFGEGNAVFGDCAALNERLNECCGVPAGSVAAQPPEGLGAINSALWFFSTLDCLLCLPLFALSLFLPLLRPFSRCGYCSECLDLQAEGMYDQDLLGAPNIH